MSVIILFALQMGKLRHGQSLWPWSQPGLRQAIWLQSVLGTGSGEGGLGNGQPVAPPRALGTVPQGSPDPTHPQRASCLLHALLSAGQ